MVITTTSAAALAAGSALARVSTPRTGPQAPVPADDDRRRGDDRGGVARLGRYTRFVSHSVMIGFLTGVSVNIVFGQLPDLTGAEAEGDVRAREGARRHHPSRPDRPRHRLLAGLAALAILVGLARTRLATLSALVALVVPTVACGASAGPTGRPGGGHRRDPERHPAARSCPTSACCRCRWSRGRWPSRPSSSSRARVSPSRRRTRTGLLEPEPGLHRPGRRQPRVRLLPRSTGRRLGRPDRAERRRPAPEQVGGDLLGPLDAGDPRCLLRRRRQSPCRRWRRCSSSPPSDRSSRVRCSTIPRTGPTSAIAIDLDLRAPTLFLPVAAAVGIGVVALAAAAAQPGGAGPAPRPPAPRRRRTVSSSRRTDRARAVRRRRHRRRRIAVFAGHPHPPAPSASAPALRPRAGARAAGDRS